MTGTSPIGFVGVGAMGAPMVEALLDAGYELVVCDVRPDATEPFAARGVAVAATPSEVAAAAETVLVSLPRPDVVRAVAGALLEGGSMRTFVDLSTTGSSATEEISDALAAARVDYLDAPVSGGVAGATARTLTVMASGEQSVLLRVRPLLDTFARNVFHVGPAPGQGQLAKLLNNLLSATALAITSEAVTFAVRAGLDPALLLDVLNASTGRNSATADKFPRHVLTRTFGSGFRLSLMAKDVELCLAEARSRRFAMPLGGLVQQLWTLAAAQADEEDDHTEFVRLCEGWAGVTVREPQGPVHSDADRPAAGRAHTTSYEVVAVRYGSLLARKSDLFYRYESYGDPDGEVEMAYYFWALKSGGETILVDTGFDPAIGRRRGRTCLCPPLEALRRLGVDAAAVSTVIVTHLHYDHIGNLAAFPHAELVVPRKEIEFWTGPHAGRYQFASHVEAEEIAWLDEARRSGRVRLTEGTEQILDGITAIVVGGHSPGQQVTVVSGAAGDVVLTSDAVHLYDELEADRPFALMADLERMYSAYDLVKELGAAPGAVVVPGHDPEVMARFPSVGDESSGLAVRIA